MGGKKGEGDGKQMGQKRRIGPYQRKKTRKEVMAPKEEKKILPFVALILKVINSGQRYDKIESEDEEMETPEKLVKARKRSRQVGAVGKGQQVARKVSKTPAKRMDSGIKVAKSQGRDKQLVWRETNGIKYKVREGITLKVAKIVLKKYQHNSQGSETSLRKTPVKRRSRRSSSRLYPNKRFKCSECTMGFTRKEILKRHLSVHKEERPWDCADCGKAFKAKSSLRRHQQRIHPDVKQFSGDVYQKSSPATSKRGREKVHVDNFRFKCSYCSKGFRFNSLLKYHLNIHTLEKSFKCTRCPKAYTRHSTLYNHMKSHSK